MSTTIRTPLALKMLEKALTENHGDLLTACREVGVPMRHVAAWLECDTDAAAAIREAQLIGWATLESAAYKRAVKGVKRAVYYKGDVCGYERVYSDGLLSQMMKARVPGYGEDESGHKGMTINVAIMPRANNYDEWVVQREKMLEKPMKVVEHKPINRTVLQDVL